MKYLALYTVAFLLFSLAARALLTGHSITYHLPMTLVRAVLELPILALALMVILRRT